MRIAFRSVFALCAAVVVSACGSQIPTPMNPQAGQWPLVTTGDRAAASSAHVAQEYVLSGVGNVFAIAKGPDGNIWFSDSVKNQVGKITPAGQLTTYALPGSAPDAEPGFLSLNIDHNLWLVHNYSHRNPALLRIDGSGRFKEFALGTGMVGAVAAGVTHDAAGDLWVAIGGSTIVRMSRRGTLVASYTTPTPNSGAYGMCYQGGLVWITELTINKIAAVKSNGSFAGEYGIGSGAVGQSKCIGLGHSVFFPAGTLFSPALGRIDTITKVVSQTSIPKPASSVESGSDRAVWMAEGLASAVGRFDPLHGTVTQYKTLTPNVLVEDVARAGDGSIWFSEISNPMRIGRLVTH